MTADETRPTPPAAAAAPDVNVGHATDAPLRGRPRPGGPGGRRRVGHLPAAGAPHPPGRGGPHRRRGRPRGPGGPGQPGQRAVGGHHLRGGPDRCGVGPDERLSDPGRAGPAGRADRARGSAWPVAATPTACARSLAGPVLAEDEVFATEVDERTAPAGVGQGDDTALVLYTSGTTGLPKPIPISHGVVADRLAFYGKPIDPDAPQVVDMMSAPIFHIAGTLGLFVCLVQGKQMVFLPKFDPGEWLDLVERHRVAQTFVVPTMLRRILDHPRFERDRPVVAALTQLRCRRLPGGPGPTGGGRLPRRGLLQHLRPDRDPRGLCRPLPRRPPAGRPLRLGRSAPGRSRAAHRGAGHRP